MNRNSIIKEDDCFKSILFSNFRISFKFARALNKLKYINTVLTASIHATAFSKFKLVKGNIVIPTEKNDISMVIIMHNLPHLYPNGSLRFVLVTEIPMNLSRNQNIHSLSFPLTLYIIVKLANLPLLS